MLGWLYSDAAYQVLGAARFDRDLSVPRSILAGLARLEKMQPGSVLVRPSPGLRDEARSLLAPVYGWFIEGFRTADPKEAKALLDELS